MNADATTPVPRRELDYYETPPHYIAALLGEVNVYGRVYEPCVGSGNIADVLCNLPSVRKVVTNDIDPKRQADTHRDARLPSAWLEHGAVDWIITNPPFSDELPILEQALETVLNVAFLARLSFLEPTEDRAYFLEQHPPQQIIVLPRYSFRPKDDGTRGTDSVTCCWLVWREDKVPLQNAIWGRGKSEAYAVMRSLE